MATERIKNFIKGHILFQDYKCDVAFMNSISRSMTVRLFPSGRFIIRKGEDGRAMFFILKGVVQVVSDDGEIILNTMKEGSVFGEIGLLFSVPR